MSGDARILVVDDYAPNRLIYREWLREIDGVDVIEATHAQHALQLARQQDFAMFLLDINMPDVDGFALAGLLREEPRAQSTPIVFLTSENAERSYLVRGYRLGAVDFMVSAPAEGEILLQKARVFLQLHRKRMELQALVEQARAENREMHSRLERFVLDQERLLRQATHDELTQLPNRTLFQDRVEAAIARARRAKQGFALACVDLDGFKTINDRHGHGTGDAVMVAVADRLKASVRESDTVARIGGDEFGLLLEGLDSAAGATYLAEKIHRRLVEPVSLLPGHDQAAVRVVIGASIGLALFPDHGGAREQLMQMADMAMYAVKRAGGGVRMHGGSGPAA